MRGCIFAFIIACLIFILAGALYLKWRINQFLTGSRQRIIDSCIGLEQIQYTSELTSPKVQGQYEYGIAKALLETSLKTTQSNCYNIIPIEPPTNFVNQDRIQGINPWSNRREMFAIVFSTEDNSKVIISFTGTMFPDEIMNDLNIRQTEANELNNYVRGALVHQGFYNVYLAIRSELWRKIQSMPIKELYITGHSLGGALSTLCAFDFAQYNPVHYSFASPRVGNVAFADQYNAIVPHGIRVYNIDDSITQVPPPIILGLVYKHVNNGVAFDVNLGNARDNHIQAYLSGMPLCVPYEGC